MDFNIDISELTKSLNKLKNNFDKDSRELTRVFGNITGALSKNFEKLNTLDLSINTRGLQNSLNGLRENFEGTSQAMAKSLKLMADSIDVSAGFMEEAERMFDEISDIQSSIRAMVEEMHDILAGIEAAREEMTGAGLFSGHLPDDTFKNPAGSWIDIVKKIGGLFFDTGGIVPGSFSQPVPVIAHGSEMILNPSQQAQLFKMLNGKEQAGQTHQTYAPQVRSGVSAPEVFDILNKHHRQLFSMVADGVQKDSSLRNSVKGAK